MTKHRIVIVGTGNSVNNHLSALKAIDDRIELVAAVDIDLARVQAFCTENNIPNYYTSVTEMLSAEKPDIVSIVTPSATHKDITIECLEAGAWNVLIAMDCPQGYERGARGASWFLLQMIGQASLATYPSRPCHRPTRNVAVLGLHPLVASMPGVLQATIARLRAGDPG